MKKYLSSTFIVLLFLNTADVYAGWVVSTSIHKLNSSSNHYKPYAHSSKDDSNDKYFSYTMSTFSLGGGYSFALDDAQTWFVVPSLELGTSLQDFTLKEINEHSAVETNLKEYNYTNQLTSILMSEFQYRPVGTDIYLLGGLQVIYQNNHVEAISKDSDAKIVDEDLQVSSLGWFAGLGYHLYWGLIISGHVGVAFNHEAEVSTAAFRLHYLF